MISEKEVLSIEDTYDLTALIGKKMGESIVSFEIKDAIKMTVKGAYAVGYDRALKDNNIKKDV